MRALNFPGSFGWKGNYGNTRCNRISSPEATIVWYQNVALGMELRSMTWRLEVYLSSASALMNVTSLGVAGILLFAHNAL